MLALPDARLLPAHGPVTESIPVSLEWLAVGPCRLALIDRRLITIAQRWPPLMAAVMRRAAQHARVALLQQAISQLPKVEDRLPRPDVKVQPVNLPIPVTGRGRSGSPIDPKYPSG